MFTALSSLPLADVTVVIFGSPFVTAALAVLLFAERIGRHRWAAIAFGFAGVVIAIRPGSEFFRPEILFAVAAGISFAGINLTARWLRDTESTFQLVFFLMAGTAVIASLGLPFVWLPMPLADLLLFGGMAAANLFGYIFMTRAFIVAPVGVVAPFEFTVLIWAVLWGFVFWGELPDAFVWSGGAAIIASGLYLLHREARAVPEIDQAGAS
jgi:drug/metabolite transporter (DMT)-like permease